jgi:hypothetical protein
MSSIRTQAWDTFCQTALFMGSFASPWRSADGVNVRHSLFQQKYPKLEQREICYV